MDWSNERYVRVYVRDTTTWKRLGFEGQSTFCLLLRKLDRTGAIELDDAEPWEVAALHAGVPEPIARTGMQRLLDAGVFELADGCLIVPNFIDAQEASMSPQMRQKEHRLRRRDELRAGIAPSGRDTAIYFVQSEHGGEIKIGRADDVAKRLVGLQTSRPDKLVLLASVKGSIQQERELHERFARHRVKGEWFSPVPELLQLIKSVAENGASALTQRHTSQVVTMNDSFEVTLNRADLNHADLSRAVPSRAQEGARAGGGGTTEEERFIAARAFVRREFAQRWTTHNARAGLWNSATSPDVDKFTAWAMSVPGDFEETVTRTLDTFFADEWVKSRHFPIGHLAKSENAAKYLQPREAAKADVPLSLPALKRAAEDALVAGDKTLAKQLVAKIREAEERESNRARR